MLFLFTLAIPVQAAEQDELATAMRQLDQVQAALERARVGVILLVAVIWLLTKSASIIL
ncbi:RAQPRD family integrative conjugative element protein [Escherichia coli]|uniref:RAQPRD family integrative conjugative element protein n=1 Tax=Escherichia coli TaxID=562 RepID=UPI0020358707|nr:RAQPRD family integrative conjugative element protein [Escherichia coli]